MARVDTERIMEEMRQAVIQAMPRCRCQKWGTYLGNYDADGYTIRCRGCLRAIWACKC